ncbi:MAG: DCC1-like thiol-disulfide oxidoreductase family protein [Acidobacteriota bacterium]|nr:DCC1-like thiol-disulfide oxidoreductase family protein [Acidobacteriota bacterium]
MLYDGVCGFCNKSVQLILDHDKRGVMRFAALQSDFGRSVIARHPELRDVDSVVVLERSPQTGAERVFVRSTAAMKLAAYLGGFWKLFLAFRVLPAPLRDYLYDAFARNRYRFFGKYDACLLPPPEVRARFIDVTND